MMTTRIVSRGRRADRARSQEFCFTREMIPLPADNGRGGEIRRTYRAHAWDVFQATPMPSLTDEPWRRTDLRNLQADLFTIPSADIADRQLPIPYDLLQPLIGDQHGGQIALTPGGPAQVDLLPEISATGVVFSDLVTAEREHPEILARVLGQVVRPEDGKFAALTGALASNGVLVYVPRGVRLTQPLHSVYWGPGLGLANFTHALILLEEGAELTYVHESASPDEAQGQALHAGIVEIHLGAGANLRFVELQSWGDQVWNFTHERAHLEQDSQLDWIYGGMGTNVTKSFLELELAGQGASGRMSGFFFAHGDQHLDLDTQQNHLAPNTTSDLLYKGALEGRSRVVWQGMIYVAPGAQKTDGYQANRNLVLSPTARADSIPGLEILADDVRCTHGATVGKIDPELVFYLQSRGLPIGEAKRLVVEGFFDPIMQRIPFEEVRERFQSAIVEKMDFGG